MKKAAKILCLFAVIVVLATAFSAVTNADNEIYTLYGREALGKLSNGAKKQAAYDVIVECIENYDESAVIFEYGIPYLPGDNPETDPPKLDELSNIVDAIYSDRPDLFWFTGSYGISYAGATAYAVLPEYSVSETVKDSMKTSLETQAGVLTSGLEYKTDLEKALYLHDRLGEQTDYQWGDNNQNAYGSIVEKKAVCAGYSRGYQYLLAQVGIPSWYVIGNSYNPTTHTSERHGWNLVKLDGDWYYTDLTWDDQTDRVFHSYFNITTSELNSDHIIEPGFFANSVPACTATEYNYFNVMGNTVDADDFDATFIGEEMRKTGGIFDFKVNGTEGEVQSFVNSFVSNVYDVVDAYKGSVDSYSYLIVKDEVMLKFTNKGSLGTPEKSLGDYIFYNFDKTTWTLYINGVGRINDFAENDTTNPLAKYQTQLSKIVVGKYIYELGDNVFDLFSEVNIETLGIKSLVVFKNYDGKLLSAQRYAIGETVTAPSTPKKTCTDTKYYIFNGWDKPVVACAGDATYTATYKEETRVNANISFTNVNRSGFTIVCDADNVEFSLDNKTWSQNKTYTTLEDFQEYSVYARATTKTPDKYIIPSTPYSIITVDREAIEYGINDNFFYMGASINPVKNGLRARVVVSSELFSSTIEHGDFKFIRTGILISKNNSAELTLDNANVLTAFKAGDDLSKLKFEGDIYYSFAAVVTGIPESGYSTNLYYRPFFEYEDANGDVNVVYAENALDSAGFVIEINTLPSFDTTTKAVTKSLYDVCHDLYDAYKAGTNNYYVSEKSVTSFIDKVLNFVEKGDMEIPIEDVK